MKMMNSIVFVGSMLVASMVLQGCISSGGGEEKKKLEEEEEALEEGNAQCMGGNFSCDGPWRSWCAEQEKKCSGSDGILSTCTPQCTYSCEKKKCDQVCEPKCGQALCSTRCKGFDTHSCKMKCGQPNCKIVCPKHFCPGKECAKCKTECGSPQCKMECSKPDKQPCHHVCAEPSCKWECKEPKDCGQPKCSMKCEKPRGCMDNTRMVQKLPALEPGETEVLGFHTSPGGGAPSPAAAASPAAASLAQVNGTASTIRVEITTMGGDRSLKQAQVEVELAPPTVRALPSWSRTIRKQGGKVTESEASCENGNFQCQGDKAWCAGQRETVCSEAAEVAEATESQASEDVVQVAEAADGALQSQESVEVVGPQDDAVVDGDAEKAAEEALGSVKVDTAFLQHRVGRQQSHLQA